MQCKNRRWYYARVAVPESATLSGCEAPRSGDVTCTLASSTDGGGGSDCGLGDAGAWSGFVTVIEPLAVSDSSACTGKRGIDTRGQASSRGISLNSRHYATPHARQAPSEHTAPSEWREGTLGASHMGSREIASETPASAAPAEAGHGQVDGAGCWASWWSLRPSNRPRTYSGQQRTGGNTLTSPVRRCLYCRRSARVAQQLSMTKSTTRAATASSPSAPVSCTIVVWSERKSADVARGMQGEMDHLKR